MAKTDHQYFDNKDSPLISVSHPSRYLNKETSTPIDYSVMHSGIPMQSHHKNTVAGSNLTHKFTNHVTKRLQPTVEKARTKNLNLHGDQTGSHSRFMQKETPKHNTYYLMCDEENDISDTYYLHNKPLICNRVEKPFQTPVNPSRLGLFPSDKRVPLSHELDNKNHRLIRRKKDLKEV
jgi:hypothetical protein|tara:strand:- start:9920 stop:10453 length:534 start_codon:yes stop_codon:yes gene_type:complete